MGPIPSRPAPVGSPSVIVGLAATHECLGVAVVVDGMPVVIDSRRLRTRRTTETLDGWIDGLVRAFRPMLIALVQGDDVRRHVASALVLPNTVDVTLDEVASRLGIARPTRAAVCREVARRHALVGSRVRFSRSLRSASERYREAAVLAAGAALTMFAEMKNFPTP